MDVQEFVDLYPRLYHAAHVDAWPSIEAHGLLSTTALLDLFEICGFERVFIESTRRPESVIIEHPRYGQAVIRDNKPITDSQLARCLTGMAPADYYRLLNQRVFFWPTTERLENHLGARLNRHDFQLVLTVDTAALLGHNSERIRLSPINSGATFRRAAPRGPATFVPIADYDFTARRRLRGLAGALAEVTIEHRVVDLSAALIEVEKLRPSS
jgi:hypothetical protein